MINTLKMEKDKFQCSIKYCKKHDRCNQNKINASEMHHFTLNDLNHQDLHYETEVLSKRLPSYFRRSLEADELKNLYQSAYIFELLFNFAQEYLPSINETNKGAGESEATKEASTNTSTDRIKDKVLEFLFKNENQVKSSSNHDEIKNCKSKQEKDKDGQKIIEEQLWNTDDLNTLRTVFASIKDENIKLNSRLLAIDHENRELKERYEILKNETKNLPAEKRNLAAENERLYIRVQDLEREYKTFSSQLDEHDSRNKELKEKYEQERKVNQTIFNEKSMFEFELRKCESELKTIKNEFKVKQTIIIEKIKIKYQNRINKLEEKIRKMQNEFEEEKEQHLKAQNALKHLRSHFMTECLPVQQNQVKLADDQIKIF